MAALSAKVATSIVQPVIQQLANPAIEEFSKFWDVGKEFEDLKASYEKIKALIERWEINGSNNNGPLETWSQKLDGYCYDTEDLVDHLHLRYGVEKQKLRRGQIFGSLSLKQGKVPHKIVELRKKLERLAGHIEGVLNARQGNNVPPRPSASAPSAGGTHCSNWSPLSDKTPLVISHSRDQMKQSIVMKLISPGSPDSSHGSGVAIIGMDGLGKTALARAILQDSRIKNHFPLVMTACVSGDLQMEGIVSRLVAAEFPHQREANAEELLRDRKTALLIILDDVWSVTEEEWHRFKCNYLSPSSSSPCWKVLTTTRNPKVAHVTHSAASYLDIMTDAECRELIMQRANLRGADAETWDTDLDILAKKCKGMPAVASKLGLILSCKTSVDELSVAFQQLKNNHLRSLPEFQQVFHSFKLNEPKLPPHLKRCFAYFSLFPSNHRFNRDELIQLWEVEGFVQTQQQKQQGQHFQPTGSDCFDEMLSRSILKPLKSSCDMQTLYEMHDFNYEFARKLACDTFRMIDQGTTPKLPASHEKSLRHLSFICDNIDASLLNKVKKCTRLRTFLFLHRNGPRRSIDPNTFYRKLESLRLLDLSHTDVCKQLESVSSLKLLRYLDLSKTDIQQLPESILQLCALQILKLEDCFKLDQLPKELNQLISLTNLHVNMKRLTCLPSNLGMLTNLEILSSYIVGCNEGSKAAELRNMENLRVIHISRLENISDRNDAEESMLSTKKQLTRLVLEWDNPTAKTVQARYDIMEGLKPHNDLKELVLRKYWCKEFPTWLSSSSQKLASVYLQGCQDCEVLPSLGKLPLLTTLVLHSIDNVKTVDREFCGQGEEGFRYLESLEFREMRGLVSWNGLKTGDMPRLHTLKIIDCPSLISLPSLIHQSCLVYFEINNCPLLESLPEMPSSMNCERGQLIILDSPLVEERCKPGGADWPKIKDTPYAQKFQTTTTSATSTILASENNEVHEDEAAPTIASRKMGEVYNYMQGVRVLVESRKTMFNHGGCFYKYSVVVPLMAVMLFWIVYGVPSSLM